MSNARHWNSVEIISDWLTAFGWKPIKRGFQGRFNTVQWHCVHFTYVWKKNGTAAESMKYNLLLIDILTFVLCSTRSPSSLSCSPFLALFFLFLPSSHSSSASQSLSFSPSSLSSSVPKEQRTLWNSLTAATAHFYVITKPLAFFWFLIILISHFFPNFSHRIIFRSVSVFISTNSIVIERVCVFD